MSIEDQVPHIVLFDTSTEEDVVINKELATCITDKDLDVSLPAVG